MIIEKIKTEYYMCRIPGLIATREGTLVGYYECRDEYSDWAKIDIKVIRSTDGGKSFEKVLLIQGEGNTLNNPVMVQKDGVIHFLFLKNYHDLFYCNSTDDGKTFTDPVDITSVFKDGGFFYNAAAVGPGHAIVHNGRIIVPVWFAYNKEEPSAHHPTFIKTLYSEDDGDSWHLGETVADGFFVNPSECALASCDDEVIISVRNHNSGFCRGFAKSKSGIGDWYDVRLADNIHDPICMGSMDVSDGRVYHINCDSDNKLRVNLTVKISDDGFKTYRSVPVDEKGGYSDIAVVGDKMHILYERDIKDNENYALCFITKKCN